MAKQSDAIKKSISTHMKSADYAEDQAAKAMRKGNVALADQWSSQAREEKKIVNGLKADLKKALDQEKKTK